MTAGKVTFSEKYVLLDNEGTMCSTSVLKPFYDYFYSTLRQYLDDHWQDAEVQTIIGVLKKQYIEDVANKVPGLVPIAEGTLERESIHDNIIWHSKLYRNSPILKTIRQLQNHIWVYGLQTNSCLKYRIFDDVIPALRQWKNNNKEVYTYSTAPLEIQKVAYKTVNNGEFFKLITDCFDMEMGVKSEPSSYLNIVSKLGCSPSDVLFITDLISEAEAASQAGVRAIISIRPDNAPISDEDRSRFVCIRSFEEIIPDGAAK